MIQASNLSGAEEPREKICVLQKYLICFNFLNVKALFITISRCYNTDETKPELVPDAITIPSR
jgi:hypothetical protein